MTPAVVESPDPSTPLGISTDIDARCECLEDFDPDALPPWFGTAGTRFASSLSRLSDDLSLWSFRPKKDLPPEDCRVLESTGAVVAGISVL